MKKIDEATFELVFGAACGWSKLFMKSQDLIREVLKYSSDDIPNELYLKCLKLLNIHELPKRFQKGGNNEESSYET